MLDDLAGEHPNFVWHEVSLRLGDALFLHGDCAHRRMDAAAFRAYRDRWSNDRRRGDAAAAAYRIADRLGITRLIHQAQFPLDQTLQRLVHHLDASQPGWRRHTRHCYFGHTHTPFSGVQRDGVTFHNTGSAIRGMGFNPLKFIPNRDPL